MQDQLRRIVHEKIATRFELLAYLLRLQNQIIDLQVENSILKDRLESYTTVEAAVQEQARMARTVMAGGRRRVQG